MRAPDFEQTRGPVVADSPMTQARYDWLRFEEEDVRDAEVLLEALGLPTTERLCLIRRHRLYQEGLLHQQGFLELLRIWIDAPYRNEAAIRDTPEELRIPRTVPPPDVAEEAALRAELLRQFGGASAASRLEEKKAQL
jgi:hypothetical protein